MKELDKSGGYASDRQLLQQQLKALPGQSAAQIKGLDAQLARANDNILQGARGRGLGFSGIPIAEQAQYAATEYAPAVARVRQSQNETQRGILGSLNSLTRDMRSQAQSIFENERNFREQRRQFEEQMRLQRENAARAAAASAAAASAPSAGDYLSQLMSSNSGGQNSAREQAIMAQAERERRLMEATAREKLAKAAASNRPRNSSGNFFSDYGRSVAQYGPLALIGKGWGW